jgi:hypothetical protein
MNELRDFAAVRDFARAHLQVVRDEARWLGVRLAEPAAWIKIIADTDDGGVAVVTPVCPDDVARLAGPTLIRRNGMYQVCIRLGFEKLTTAILEETLKFVAASAWSMHREVIRAAGVLEVAEPFAA